MKTKVTYLVILVAMCLIGEAQQILNGGLETWISTSTPTGWTTIEDLVPPIAGTGLSVKDSIDKVEGNSSIKLTSKYVSLAGDTVPGILALGTGVFGGSGPIWYGTPFIYKPDTLFFSYKYEPVGSDTGSFELDLHKTGGGNTYILTEGKPLTSTGGQWVNAYFVLTSAYTDHLSASDTMILKFYSTNHGGGMSSIKARVGSTLHVDAIRLGYVPQAAPPVVYTMGHDPITGHDFNFYGAINTSGATADYSFVYSTDSTFATSVSTPLKSKTDNQLDVVWATVTNLLPNSTYYYYLTGTTSGGTANGKTMHFFSDTINPIFENQGGDCGLGWVQLNGRLTRFHTNLALMFEYGLTPDLGTEIIPSDVTSVTDSFQHYFRAYPASLLSNQLYFFRARAISATDTFYTDIRGFYTGYPYSINQILPCSNLTDISADINAQTQGFQYPVKLKMEIFDTMLMTHMHTGYQYHDMDTAMLHYLYHATNLVAGHFYETRYRAETWIGNYYDDSSFNTTGGISGLLEDVDMESKLTVYPNPSNAQLTVELKEGFNTNATLQLFETNGQLLKEIVIPAYQNKIFVAVSDLATGLYELKLIVGNTISNKKIAVIK